MHRVWIAVASVWALLAIVAVLAWTYGPVQPLAQPAGRTVVVKGVNGKQQLVVVQPAGAAHATTHTSAVAP